MLKEIDCFHGFLQIGETALHYCAKIPPKIENQTTYIDLVKLLLDNHAEFNIPALKVEISCYDIYFSHFE